MVVDLVPADAELRHRLGIAFGIAAVVTGDRVHARGRARPFRVERRCDRYLSRLVGAAVADEHDVAEAMLLETPSGVLEHLTKDWIGDADGSRKPHVTGRRVDAAFRG